jgi:hypothetical protein
MANKNAWVLVETVEMYRMRYVVECPEDNPEYAIDIVKSRKANEFSQKHLGETVISSAFVLEKYLLALCDSDNDLKGQWTKAQKIKNHFTKIEGLT